MCGIVGFLTCYEHVNGSEVLLTNMASKIQSRGPDSQGIWFSQHDRIGLGHRRLAVQDLSVHGVQPMHSPNDRYVIVFNGEIYNHAYLRSLLDADTSINWRGHSDTETLLACFDTWGIDNTITQAVGMFAFAVWDKLNKTLTLGRDRLGEKPLYYGWQGVGHSAIFLFGSELKALSAHPSFVSDIDRNSLSLYMRYGYVPSPYSIYKNINKLMPGCMLTVSLDRPTPNLKAYWSVGMAAEAGLTNPFLGTPKEAVIALDSVLKSAISSQMVADVPLGAFLSGGVDSSTVVALMQTQSNRPIKTFSIGFHEDLYNEAAHASRVAAHLGTEHTELYLSPEQSLAVIPKLPIIYDEPFADSSQIPTFLVSQMAREQVTVCLSGDAGDELFAGYNRYQLVASMWEKLASWPLPIRKAVGMSIQSVSPTALNRFASILQISKRWTDVGYKLHKGADVLSSASASEVYQRLVSHWQNPDLIVLGSKEPPTLLTGNRPPLRGLNDVEQMMALDMLTYLPDDILTKVDRAAMGVSLETRVPFLDHRVVEFAWSLPLDYKLRKELIGYTTKWALKEVLYQYVPKKIIDRPKMGFGIPIDSWLRGPLKDWAEDLLSIERMVRDGYLNPVLIRQRWKEHLSGKRNWQHSLWCVLMFQAWLDERQKS